MLIDTIYEFLLAEVAEFMPPKTNRKFPRTR